MVFEKDEFLISLRSTQLLKAYIGFILADIIAILFLNNIFNSFDIYVYTFIRAVCISFSIAICIFKQLVVLGKKLYVEYKYIFNELDTTACDEDGGVTDEQWASTKKVLKIILATMETGLLFTAQALSITYFRERFFGDNGLNIVICLILMGTLTYLSRNYLNKKYCI